MADASAVGVSQFVRQLQPDVISPSFPDLWKGGVSKAERMRPEADYPMSN